MNKFIFLLCFFYINISFSQIKNGSIDYGIISNLDEKEAKVDFIIDMINNVKESSKSVKLTLNFNDLESYFFINPVILKQYNTIDDYAKDINIKSKCYVSISKDKYLNYNNDELLGEYILSFDQESKWTLTQETKIIGGYLCYKATSPYFNGENWFEDSKSLVTAWYTPKIPFQFGPNGYHGLPGLILELQTGVSTIFVKEINLNLEKNPEIQMLDNVRLLTLGQRNILASKAMSAENKKWIEEQQAIIDKKKKESSSKQNSQTNKEVVPKNN